MDEDRSCQISVQVGSLLHIAGQPRSERSARSVSSARCGSRSHPWLLEAQTGQKVNISLLDFSGHGRRTQLDTRGLVSDDCSPAHVQQKHKHVYQSNGNMVEVVLGKLMTNDSGFLLAVEGSFYTQIIDTQEQSAKTV